MKISKKTALLVVIGLVIGALLTTAIRFITYKSDAVHYHANFALYLNDKRDLFDGPGFYEEVESCGSAAVDNPKVRVHLHDENPGLMHVHDHAVTWGQLFENLGYSVSDKAITTATGDVYVDGQDGNKLMFELNGKEMTSIANRVIASEDKLLINYGQDSDDVIMTHYSTVPADAHKANTENDPATCSGGKPLTTTQRLKSAVGF